MSAWVSNDGFYFVQFVEWCLVPCVLSHGSDVFLSHPEDEVRQGCMSVLRAVDSSIGSLVTRDADVARQPAEVNVEV